MRLGRRPHDPEALASAPVHRFGAVRPPLVLDRQGVDFTPQLFGNDTLPDCTAVALANLAGGVAALNGFGLVINPDRVPAFYAGCVGYPPDLAATDGAIALDVLARQARDGFDIGPQSLYGQYGTIDPASRTGLALGMAQLGGVYLGVTLRDREMNVSDLWDIAPGRDDGPVIGGHMVTGWDYGGLGDDDLVRISTWGRWQLVTWAWLHARLDEAHGVVWRQLGRADGMFWSGQTADALALEIAA